MPHKEQSDWLCRLLRQDDYPLEATADAVLARFEGNGVGEVLALAIGLGHLDLAAELMQRGVAPSIFEGNARQAWSKQHPFYRLGRRSEDALMVAATFWGEFRPPCLAGRRQGRDAVVAFLLDHKNTVPDGMVRMDEALVHSMGLAGVDRGREDTGELMSFQDALVQAGASPDFNDPFLANLLSLANLRDRKEMSGTFHLDRVLSWKPDLALQSGQAYVMAIREDAGTSSWGWMAERLRERGVPLHWPKGGSRYSHPLVQAIWRGCRPAVREMVGMGIDFSWREGRTGSTLLGAAAATGKSGKQMIKVLDMLPGDEIVGLVNTANARGWTPLHEACYHLNLPVVEWLLVHGANPNATNEEGKTPLQVIGTRTGAASIQVVPKVIRALMVHGGATSSQAGQLDALHQAATSLDAALCKTLVEQGADPNAKGKGRKTPMMLALQSCLVAGAASPHKRWKREPQMVGVARVLLDAGVDVNSVVAPYGRTLLHVAVLNMLPLLCEELLARGARSDVLDKKGCSPMNPGDEAHRSFLGYVSTETSCEVSLRILAAFRSAGVHLTQPDAAGKQPFSVLQESGAVDAIIAQEKMRAAIPTSQPGRGARARM